MDAAERGAAGDGGGRDGERWPWNFATMDEVHEFARRHGVPNGTPVLYCLGAAEKVLAESPWMRHEDWSGLAPSGVADEVRHIAEALGRMQETVVGAVSRLQIKSGDAGAEV